LKEEYQNHQLLNNNRIGIELSKEKEENKDASQQIEPARPNKSQQTMDGMVNFFIIIDIFYVLKNFGS